MVALLLSIAIGFAQPKELTWQQALDKIAPHMAGFKVSKDQEKNELSLTRIIKQAGLPIGEERTGLAGGWPGFLIDYSPNPVKVQGMDAVIVKICRIVQAPRHDPNESVLAVFVRTGNRMKASRLREALTQNGTEFVEVSCEYAAFSGSRLVTAGLDGWGSNAPHPCVRVWERRRGGWFLSNEKTAPFESFVSPRLTLNPKGEVTIEQMTGRTYPRYLSACHATALLTYRQKLVLDNGKLRTVSFRLVDSPFNLLDRLFKAICDSDKSFICSSSASAEVARQILALSPRPHTDDDTFFSDGEGTYCRKIAIPKFSIWFHFAKKGGKWVVAKLTPYKRV